MPANIWKCANCGYKLVVDHEFKPNHCPQCRKKYGESTEQWETGFSADTDFGGDWEPPEVIGGDE